RGVRGGGGGRSRRSGTDERRPRLRRRPVRDRHRQGARRRPDLPRFGRPLRQRLRQPRPDGRRHRHRVSAHHAALADRPRQRERHIHGLRADVPRHRTRTIMTMYGLRHPILARTAAAVTLAALLAGIPSVLLKFFWPVRLPTLDDLATPGEPVVIVALLLA